MIRYKPIISLKMLFKWTFGQSTCSIPEAFHLCDRKALCLSETWDMTCPTPVPPCWERFHPVISARDAQSRSLYKTCRRVDCCRISRLLEPRGPEMDFVKTQLRDSSVLLTSSCRSNTSTERTSCTPQAACCPPPNYNILSVRISALSMEQLSSVPLNICNLTPSLFCWGNHHLLKDLSVYQECQETWGPVVCLLWISRGWHS